MYSQMDDGSTVGSCHIATVLPSAIKYFFYTPAAVLHRSFKLVAPDPGKAYRVL